MPGPKEFQPSINLTTHSPQVDINTNIYARLLQDRTVWLAQPVEEVIANITMAQLLFLETEAEDDHIYMYINSTGGRIEAALAMYDTMQLITPEIVTICAGTTSGVATLLLAAGAPGKRFALPNSIIYHAFPQVHPDIGMENSMMERYQQTVRGRMYKILAQHTGRDLEKVARDFEKPFYMTAEEAIEFGIIDDIISKEKLLDLR
jgi:ATP-dependent Clp protease, protease subunit